MTRETAFVESMLANPAAVQDLMQASDVSDQARASLADAAVDYVSLQDYEDAIGLLQRMRVPWRDGLITLEDAHNLHEIGTVGREWRERAIGHLTSKVDRYFRDRAPIKDEKAFMAMLKTMAQGYRDGAQALEWAARRLKDTHHDSHGANETHKAALTMARAAQELIGDE